jgi:hypothetical protein
MAAAYSYQIGTSYGTLANLETLATPVSAPRHTLLVYSKPTPLSDGSVRALGWPTTTWHWDFLTQAQYTALRAYCSGLSAVVYINTKKNTAAYQTYRATMLWPEQEPEYTAGKLLDITVKFVAMAEVSS